MGPFLSLLAPPSLPSPCPASWSPQTRPLIMWNPRLFSGDVGIGLNVRRLREFFLACVMRYRALLSGA